MSTTAPLLQLPSEIRNLIWMYVFADHQVVPSKNRKILRHVGCLACSRHPNLAPQPWSSIHQALLTCRQIYAEASQILYSDIRLHLNENIFTMYGLTRPYPRINNRVKQVILWMHIDDDNRNYWTDSMQSLGRAFPNMHHLTINAHMRSPDSYEKLIDAISLAGPIVRYSRDRSDLEITLNFDYTYEDVMFDSPYLGQIRTSDAREEHELVVRDLIADPTFIEASLAEEEDDQILVSALLRTARAHEQSWFEKLQRRNAARLRQHAEQMRTSQQALALSSDPR